jgi:hypothetical protein
MPTRSIVALVLFSSLTLASCQAAPAWPGAEWRRSEPEAQGMSSVELDARLSYLAARKVVVPSTAQADRAWRHAQTHRIREGEVH